MMVASSYLRSIEKRAGVLKREENVVEDAVDGNEECGDEAGAMLFCVRGDQDGARRSLLGISISEE